VECLPCPDVQITLMERGVLHCLDCTDLHSLDHSRYGSTESISKCLPTVRTNLQNAEPKQDNQTELDMELDLQMPKHNGRIQRKRSIQGCAKTSLEVCKGRIRFPAITRSRNTGVPDFIHRVTLCPEQRYEDEADNAVAGRAEV
jgi:hypothetical protein